MYKEHVPQIAALGKSEEGFLGICRFTLHTIRRQFHTVDLDNKLMKNSNDAWEHITNHVNHIHSIVTDPNKSLEEKAILGLCQARGLGLAKSGFILQMMEEPIGCIDTHNLKKLGRNPNWRIYNPTLASLKDDFILEKNRNAFGTYLGMCYSKPLGNPQKMWDSWCEYIAKSYPKHYKDAEEVSAQHLRKVKEFAYGVRTNAFST